MVSRLCGLSLSAPSLKRRRGSREHPEDRKAAKAASPAGWALFDCNEMTDRYRGRPVIFAIFLPSAAFA
jgi:hypothetical protein